MRLNTIAWLWLGVLLTAGSGCGRVSTDTSDRSIATNRPSELIARVHWLGKGLLAGDTNATRLMQIWREPESSRVEAQTLDKLAAFLGRTNWDGGVPTNSAVVTASATNSPSSNAGQALRPLLEDVVNQECYLEVREADSNRVPELTFAIRLGVTRAAFWQTNLAVALTALNGLRPIPSPGGWELTPAPKASASHPHQFDLATSRLQFTRVDDWVLLALSDVSHPAFTNSESLLRTLKLHNSTNWLEAELDPVRLSSAFGLGAQPPANFPALSITAYGDGQNVHTRGELRFPQTLPFLLEPWVVPTNRIGKQIIGFTAARSLTPVFRLFGPFSHCLAQVGPGQGYVWNEFGAPFHLYFALLVQDARGLVNQIAPPLAKLANARLPQACGSLVADTNAGTLSWDGLQYCSPFLGSVTNANPQWIVGGFGPQLTYPKRRMPAELLDHIYQGTNLVYYDFELTGQRLVQFRYLDDVYRILFDTHGPRLSKTASLDWMAVNLTNLDFAATEVRQEDPMRLSLARRSTVGLTASEIELLANWLELPDFPRGLSTLLETNGAPPLRMGKLWQAVEQKRQRSGVVAPQPGKP